MKSAFRPRHSACLIGTLAFLAAGLPAAAGPNGPSDSIDNIDDYRNPRRQQLDREKLERDRAQIERQRQWQAPPYWQRRR